MKNPHLLFTILFFLGLTPLNAQNQLNPQDIGHTIYDLQSNNSMQRRLVLEEDGTLHAIYQFGTDTLGYPDRGTVYNVRKNGKWKKPSKKRLENTRTGWPTIGKTASGRLFVVAHSDSLGLVFLYKDTKKQKWEQSVIPKANKVLWARSTTDGNHIYVLTSHEDIDKKRKEEYSSKGIAFYHSKDQGDSWEGPFYIPEISKYYKTKINADNYDIDAHAGKVAFVLTKYAEPIIAFTSTNHGRDWEALPIAPLDSPVYLNDYRKFPRSLANQVSIVIDNDGIIHVAGAWIFNFNLSPEYWSESKIYDAMCNGILYWKEGMSNFQLIGNTLSDIFKEDFDDSKHAKSLWGFYGATAVGQPSIAVDENNQPFIAYSSIIKRPDNQKRYSRDIFIVKGIQEQGNQGQSAQAQNKTKWEGPFNVSNTLKTEEAFPYLPTRILNGAINLMYQSDSLLGTSTQEPKHRPIKNNIKVVTLNADQIKTPAYKKEDHPPIIRFSPEIHYTTKECLSGLEQFSGMQAWDFPDGFIDVEVIKVETMPNPPIETDNNMRQEINSEDSLLAVTFSATDSDGLTITKTLEVIAFKDNSPPYISLKKNPITGKKTDKTVNPIQIEIIETNRPSVAGKRKKVPTKYTTIDPNKTKEWIDPGVVITDNCPCMTLKNNVKVEGEVNINQLGNYQLTYTAWDAAGNTSTAIRHVAVNAHPEIKLHLASTFIETIPNVYTYTSPKDYYSIGLVGTDADIIVEATDDLDTNILPKVVDAATYMLIYLEEGKRKIETMQDTTEIGITATDYLGQFSSKRMTIVHQDPELFNGLQINSSTTRGTFKVNYPSKGVLEYLQVFDQEGNAVFYQENYKQGKPLKLEHLPKGDYWLKIQMLGQIAIKRFIVE